MDSENAFLDRTGTYLNQKFREQSWFRKNSNTVTAAAGLAATVVAWIASQPFAVSTGWQVFILIAGFVLSVLGVKNTPNGISNSQMSKINAAAAKHIGETPLVEGSVDDDTGVQLSLDDMVRDFLKSKRE